jgi:hypothetical protein
MSGSSLDEAYISNVDNMSASESILFSNMDWPINENSIKLHSKSHSNVFSQNEKEEELPIINMKKVLETFTTLKSDLKKKQTSKQINENALKEIKTCEENVNKSIMDSLRIFGGKSDELLSITGLFSNIIKQEAMEETTRLESLQEEMLKDEYKMTDKIGQCAKMLKECVKDMSDEQRETFQNPALCGICVENSVTYVYNPCGHTICQACRTSSRGYNCHICRTYIKECIKIFFS